MLVGQLGKGLDRVPRQAAERRGGPRLLTPLIVGQHGRRQHDRGVPVTQATGVPSQLATYTIPVAGTAARGAR